MQLILTNGIVQTTEFNIDLINKKELSLIFTNFICLLRSRFTTFSKCYKEMQKRASHFVFLNHKIIWGRIMRNPSPDTPNAIQSFMLSGSSNKNVIFSAII